MIYITLALSGAAFFVGILILSKLSAKKEDNTEQHFAVLREKLDGQSQMQNDRIEHLQRTSNERLQANITAIETMRKDVGDKLERIRKSVDEQLQTALEKRITEAFKQVNDHLAQVQISVGKVEAMASGVGNLEKLLGNNKTRGIIGEQQLGAILEQIMSPDQYDTQVQVTARRTAVDFAVRLPGEQGGEPVWLPIDAKFPSDPYTRLLDAYDANTGIEEAARELKDMIQSSARDIRDKYIVPPHTTDFAVMFLPAEGLYAEVLRLNIAAELQSKYKIIIAGPTTMAALLNSLQMGFETLRVQKDAAEIQKMLSVFKQQFGLFGEVFKKIQKDLRSADKNLDEMITDRLRIMEDRMRNVKTIDQPNEQQLPAPTHF